MEKEQKSHELDILPEDQVEDVIGAGYFSDEQLDAFFQLVTHRRSLPVYANGIWYCYECCFQAGDIQTMSVHILKTHNRAPVNEREDEKLEDEWFSPINSQLLKSVPPHHIP